MSDKFQFVVGFGKRLLGEGGDKLKFVGHFLPHFPLTFHLVIEDRCVRRKALLDPQSSILDPRF
jgi:hypothetical protein